MRHYLLRRLGRMALVVWLVTVAVFTLLRFSGDPTAVMLPFDATAAQQEALRREMGLDRPLVAQYVRYLGRIARGDLGSSLRYRQPVLTLVLERLPATIMLTLAGVGLALVLGTTTGVVQAYFRNSWVDRLATVVTILIFSMPVFWLGMLLIMLFAVQLGWLPSSGMGGVRYVILPALTLAAFLLAYVSMLVKERMVAVLGEDYIRTARAKGLTTRRILFKHGLRNAAIPVASLVALQTGTLLGGAVITESVFQWPGIGLLALQAISFRDFPVVQGAALFLAIAVVTMNLVADLSYAALDPRIRYG
jgi:peptide/nickel transport system permease protein